jgi:hypothetical protein
MLPVLAVAEYNGHQIEFVMNLTDGSEIHAYNYLPTTYRKDESVSYAAYLEQNYELVLNNQFNDSVGDWAYYAYRIKYNFADEEGNDGFIYMLTDKKGIDKVKIESIHIISLTDQSYAIGISSYHAYEDRLWMSINAIEMHSYGGRFCSHDIFIHEKSAETDVILQALEDVIVSHELKIKALEEVMSNSDGAPYYEAEESINDLEEELDVEISGVLQNFDGMKVVIITMCTC